MPDIYERSNIRASMALNKVSLEYEDSKIHEMYKPFS